MASVFFAYPSRPASLAETLRNASELLNRRNAAEAKTWQDLSISGRVIIDAVLAEIRSADVVACEITHHNENVMFELGYAVSRGSRIWLLCDDTDEEAAQLRRDVRLLTTIGYTSYDHSETIYAEYGREAPYNAPSLFDESILPGLRPGAEPGIFYVASAHRDEASNSITRRLNKLKKLRGLVMADPEESPVNPLGWYADKIFQCEFAIVHFAAPRRAGSAAHNARAAFIAGMAHGMDKPLLMLAEEGYDDPIDYRDLLYVYPTAAACLAHLEDWLAARLPPGTTPKIQRSRQIALARELRALNLGEHVAENETEQLSTYFVPTSAYQDIIDGHSTIFAGRKGVGKTANLVYAAQELEGSRLIVPCVIQPIGYEVEAVVRLLQSYTERDLKGFLIESVWKYLILTEVALSLCAVATNRPAPVAPNSPEWDLLQLVESKAELLDQDFAVRLERGVNDLLSNPPRGSGVGESRIAISEALHSGILSELRSAIGKALGTRQRIHVLVDNLDRAWEDSTGIADLSEFLLGLLNAVDPITNDLSRERRGVRVPIALTVFLRSDILSEVLKGAREPDKIKVRRIEWKANEVLLRVIEERYMSAGPGRDPAEFWSLFFVDEIGDRRIRDFLLYRILPRPRDLIYYVNAAIGAALDRRLDHVEESAIEEADQSYSEFALNILEVETSVSSPWMSSAVYNFSGGPGVVSTSEVIAAIEPAIPAEVSTDDAIRALRRVSFLGIETHRGFFYGDDPAAEKVADAQAKRLESERGAPSQYRIHPAFRPFLQIADDPTTQGEQLSLT